MYLKFISFWLYTGKKNPEFEIQDLRNNFNCIIINLKCCYSA